MSKQTYYYHRITFALDDLLRCRRYCEEMLKQPIGSSFTAERTIYEALFVAFIVSYGRVFATSKSVNSDCNEHVSNKFGSFRKRIIDAQDEILKKFHERVIERRDTAIAHSDAKSRNLQNYNNSALLVGRNPYIPYDHVEVTIALNLVNNLITHIGEEQTRIAKIIFTKDAFGRDT